jgi:hypothetical protein
MNRWRWRAVALLSLPIFLAAALFAAPARLIRVLFKLGRWLERPYRYAVLRSLGWRKVGSVWTKGRPVNRRTARL